MSEQHPIPTTYNFNNLTGRRFGRLTVISYAGCRKKKSYWNCVCDCKTERIVPYSCLANGHSQSCGCLHVERRFANDYNRKHGKCRTPIYKIWHGIKSRCLENNENCAKYYDRGIKVCQRWSESFDAFESDMGPRPPGTSIDRIDNNGNYEPGNCRWATTVQQNRNKRSNRLIEYNGTTQPLSVWAEKTGISRVTISDRLNRGWTIADALTKPSARTYRPIAASTIPAVIHLPSMKNIPPFVSCRSICDAASVGKPLVSSVANDAESPTMKAD